MSADENEVEYADAEKSCYYQKIATLEQGNYVVIRNRPCQIFDKMRYARGRHGTFREFTVFGKDLFNSDLYQLAKCDVNVRVPVVKRSPYKVVGANETFLSLVNENDKTEKCVHIPDNALGQEIRNKLDSNQRDSLLITLMSAMGEHKIEAVYATTDTE